jgi:hypothetical protein
MVGIGTQDFKNLSGTRPIVAGLNETVATNEMNETN